MNVKVYVINKEHIIFSLSSANSNTKKNIRIVFYYPFRSVERDIRVSNNDTIIFRVKAFEIN